MVAKKRYKELPDELFDARFKLLKCQRENMIRIKEMYPDYTYKELGKQYSISAGLAWMICNPREYERIKEKNNERKKGGRYYDSEKAVEQNRRSRRKVKILTDVFELGSKSSSNMKKLIYNHDGGEKEKAGGSQEGGESTNMKDGNEKTSETATEEADKENESADKGAEKGE